MPTKPRGNPKRRTNISILGTTIAVYSNKEVADALAIVSDDMKLWRAAKLSLVLEAVYLQGRVDGAHEAFDVLESAKRSIVHRNPGRPKKRK